MIEASDPLKKEKDMTPTIMIMMQNIFSSRVLPEWSPYPTVVIVVTVK